MSPEDQISEVWEAVIKHTEDFNEVREEIRDLEEQVKRLKGWRWFGLGWLFIKRDPLHIRLLDKMGKSSKNETQIRERYFEAYRKYKIANGIPLEESE